MASGAGGGGVPPPIGEGGMIPELYLDYMKTILTPHLVAEACFEKFFIDFDVFDVDCFKYTLSKGLGLGIIAGSLMVKVPQILKIIGGGSAAGITFLSVLLELFAITANLAYSFVSGYPFSAWGEACFLAVQTVMVGMLVLWYNSGSPFLTSLSFVVGYASCVYGLVSGLTPLPILRQLQTAIIPVIIVSKFLQAWTNYRNGSTGALSAVTIFLLFGGAVARVFTSIQETGDPTLVLTYVVASSVNGMIAFQMLWYWNARIGDGGKSKGKKQQQKSKPTAAASPPVVKEKQEAPPPPTKASSKQASSPPGGKKGKKAKKDK